MTKLSAHGGLSGQVPNLGAYPDKCPWALFHRKTVVGVVSRILWSKDFRLLAKVEKTLGSRMELLRGFNLMVSFYPKTIAPSI